MSEAKVALITGSSSGIGASTVKLFSKRGYKVVVTGSKQEKVDQVAAECLAISPQKFEPLKLVLDLSNPENGEVAVKETVNHFGRLDVLVNNAGIFVKTPAFDPNTYDLYRHTMSINIDATVKCSLAAIEPLKKTKGNIVFVSSVASTKPASFGYAYCMSKAAMTSFAKSLAIDLADDNIRVNTLSPGPVLTPIFGRVGLNDEQVKTYLGMSTLQNRVGETDEISSAIFYLASDEASFVNGHEMVVDGGYSIKPMPLPIQEEKSK